ncbi:UNVERIFIED_CONTAM: hypothetical protein HDU68_006899 [Siphonaria sp. JEL0065]|nr:hypothetical protein HDU68_006899 [Siphonaria sp. JEL0065]
MIFIIVAEESVFNVDAAAVTAFPVEFFGLEIDLEGTPNPNGGTVVDAASLTALDGIGFKVGLLFGTVSGWTIVPSGLNPTSPKAVESISGNCSVGASSAEVDICSKSWGAGAGKLCATVVVCGGCTGCSICVAGSNRVEPPDNAIDSTVAADQYFSKKPNFLQMETFHLLWGKFRSK